MTRAITSFAAVAAGALSLAGSAQAESYTWTGAAAKYWSVAANWSQPPVFAAENSLYFSQYADGAANRTVQIDTTGGAIGALVFGPETGGEGNAASIIGERSYVNTLAGLPGASLGLGGDLAAASVGIWVKSGAGADGLYYNSGGSSSLAQNGATFSLGGAVTFVNDSSQPFVLNARFVDAATPGSIELRNGQWLTNYNVSATAEANFNTFTGGVTIENATWTVDVAATVNPDSARSVFGKGVITLGGNGSSSDAVLVLGGLGHSTRARISVSSGNFVEVSDGAGQRIIRNANALPKQLYSKVTLNGGATLVLDNAGIEGASFELSASNGNGVGADSDLLTGVRGSGNLYLTGGGTFFTNAGVDNPANGPRNSFTGATTVHQGTLRFDLAGGFFKTSRFQIDKDGVLEVSTTSGTYAIGDSAFLSGAETQTLAGTGQVRGAVVLGSQSILRPGGADVTGRSALSFDSALALGPLTIIDFSSDRFGAANVAGDLAFGGELRLSLNGAELTADSYQLFSFLSSSGDLASVTVYNGAIQVGTLTHKDDLWYGTISGGTYYFDERNGLLATTVVPEPGTVALLVAGALLLGLRLRPLRNGST